MGPRYVNTDTPGKPGVNPGTALFTTLAMVAFAANSVLCRLALGANTIDPGSFTVVRLLSGALVLSLILAVRLRGGLSGSTGSWRAAFMLFLYAAAFSWSYVSLETATGALVLFGTVQLTMLIHSVATGVRISRLELTGLLLAMAGFILLLLPGVSAPPLSGFLLMVIAGIAWGGYTLLGRTVTAPLEDTAFNFLRTAPMVLVLSVLALLFTNVSLSMNGVLLAVLSGALASGIGYAIWYRALNGLSSLQAGVVQLTVPVIAAAGGVVWVAETPGTRLVVSSVVVLGGIAMVFMGRDMATKGRALR